MMNSYNDEMGLGLTLGYSSDCIRIRLNRNSGAGANAGSIVDMTFAASDSLSELVWSSHNGLSLKCAECSLADKKPFLLWNVEPSKMLSSPSMSCNETDDDKNVGKNLIISQATFHWDFEIAQRDSLTQSPRNSVRPIVGSSHGQNMESRDQMEEGKIEEEVLVKHKSQNVDHLGEANKELCDSHNKRMAEMSERSQKNTGPYGSNFDMATTEALSGNLNKEILRDLNPIVRSVVVGGQILEEVTTNAEVLKEVLPEDHVTTLQKPTCLDEPTKEEKRAIEEERKNKIKTQGSMMPIMDNLEYTAENDLCHPITIHAYQQGERRLVRGCSIPLETSPEKGSSLPYPLEGKNKASSETNVSGRFLHDMDDSQESVESCNSAGLLGKRQWNFDQHLICESKRFKKQIDGRPASTSVIGQDSSFMNWISNMVNGFSKSDQEESPSLDLTLAHPSHEILQETTIRSTVSRNMGFQTIFKSLYSPSTKLLEAAVSRDDCSLERLQDLVQADKTNIQSSPVSSSLQNGASFGHIFTANEKILPSPTEVIVGGQSDQPLKLSADTRIQNDSRTDSAEDKSPSNQECCEGKNEVRSSSDSLGNHKITVSDNNNPCLASDGRATYDLSNKWITRFSTNDEFSPDLKEIDEHKYQHSVLKMNFLLSSQGFKSSEAMASVFASRLDALKNVIPSEVKNDATCTESTCFFCGKSGHSLRDCSEVTETELNDLLRNVSSYGWPENSPSLCIRCFQLDHWAIVCPLVSSSRQQQLENKMFSINCCNADNQEFGSGNERNPCLLDTEDHLKVSIYNRANLYMNTGLRNLMSTGEELSGKRSLGSDETHKQITSNSGENKVREHQNVPLCNLISMQIAEVPTGMFEAVRRLQVSRADILKCINSNVSFSHLEGLFLRLRLGKWEAGLGGTGYYVAHITAEKAEAPAKDTKTCISVNVGGIKCLVGSRYISNHDFLEDELMVWWSRTLKSGDRVPSTADLESKLEQRIKLGFKCI